MLETKHGPLLPDLVENTGLTNDPDIVEFVRATIEGYLRVGKYEHE